MRPAHVLLFYLGRTQSDDTLRSVAELCRRNDAQLSVVLPVVDAAVPSGCCGIDGEQWRRLMDEEDQAAGQRAVRLLESFGCSPNDVAIEVGRSVPDIAREAAERRACDLVAVSRKRWPWSAGGLSRRQLRQLRRGGANAVLELSDRSADHSDERARVTR
jgi:nucleotide-binding universal stress UspA family protein